MTDFLQELETLELNRPFRNYPLRLTSVGRHMYSSYANVFIQLILHLGDEFNGRAKNLLTRDQRSFVYIFFNYYKLMFRETPEVNSMLIRQYAQGFSVFGPMDFTRPRPQNAIFLLCV